MKPVLDDARLIAGSIADPTLFAGIFDRHASPLLAYLVRRVGRNDAEDLLGELFRIAFESRHRYDPARPDVRPWLYGIASNLVLKHHRSNGRRDNAVRRLMVRAADDESVPFDETIVSAAADVQRVHLIGSLLDQLANIDREVVLLYAWEQLSYEQIAEVLDIPVGTVRSRLNRVRRQLRELDPASGKEPEQPNPRAEEGTCR